MKGKEDASHGLACGVERRGIYVDHNATAPMLMSVYAAMEGGMRTEYGNASSAHYMGQQAREVVEIARARVGKRLNADPNEVYFTSGGTEANNWALRGTVSHVDGPETIITTMIEHHSILHAADALMPGVRARYIGMEPRDVVLKYPDAHEKLLHVGEDGALLTVMHANNETGNLHEIDTLARWAHEFSDKIIVHTDAVQTFGKIPVDVKALEVDMLTVSAHKIGGPKGVGALYIKKGTPIVPLLYGGHQERDMRAGTENVAGIVGFGVACCYGMEGMAERQKEHDHLRRLLLNGIVDSGHTILVNTYLDNSIPNTLNVSFRGVDSEALLMMLDTEGIFASNGAACEAGTSDPSHVLIRMGRSDEDARAAIRFSLGRGNTPEQMDEIVRALAMIVPALRSM